MNTITKQTRLLLISVLLILGVACGQQPTAEPVDTEAIAQLVLTQLQAENAEPNAQAITDSAVATVTAQQTEPVSAEAITEDVMNTIQTQLDQQGQLINTNNNALAMSNLALQDTLTGLYEQANPATVYIIVPPFGSGSGWVFNDEGYIVTNNHVVEGGSTFEVVFSNGDRQRARLIGTDVDSDLAVIKVDEMPANTQPLPLADFNNVKVGQFVIAIGNPFGEQGSMSLGIISGLDRSLTSANTLQGGGSYSLPQVIQTDAPINPGNSGGPLINLQGEVVGVNSAIRTTTGTNSGVGFSVPVAAVARIVPNIIQFGEHQYSYMGVSFSSELSLAAQEQLGLPTNKGAYVASLVAGGPANQAGLIAANSNTGLGGDLITAINGVPINDFSDLNSYLVLNTAPNDTIQITIIRNSEEITIPLTLGERP
jgi:2-alkenal reductase